MGVPNNIFPEMHPEYGKIGVMFHTSRLSTPVRSSKIAILLSLIFLLALSIEVRASQKIVNSNGPIIVSVSNPKDSRGELVYEIQGEEQKDQPVVAGTFVQPSPTKLPQPKYPKSHKKERTSGNITVEGVVAQNGEFIDAKVVEGADPDFSQRALDAVARYEFRPATLDGKPVAILTRVVVSFRIW